MQTAFASFDAPLKGSTLKIDTSKLQQPKRPPTKLGARFSIVVLSTTYLFGLSILLLGKLPQKETSPRQLLLYSSQPRGLRREERSRSQGGSASSSVAGNDTANHSLGDAYDGHGVTVSFTLPPPKERVPNFIIIGAQKSGTQALRTYLSEHPNIEIPTEWDEPHFFDWHYEEDETPEQNLNIYAESYHDHDCRKRLCIAGEATPSYLFDTDTVPERIKDVCPWTKFIVLLRNPVKRAYSQHNMLDQRDEIQGKKRNFRTHLDRDLKWMKENGLVGSDIPLSDEEEYEAWQGYQDHENWNKFVLGRGMYDIQLRAWFKYFPRGQFLILKSEDLDGDRASTMKRVYNFLGVPYQDLEEDEKVHERNYTTKPMSEGVESFLYDFYRPYNKRLATLLGPEWEGVWERSFPERAPEKIIHL